MSTYGHVIEELEDQPNLSAEEAIRQAREQVGTRRVPLAAGQQRRGRPRDDAWGVGVPVRLGLRPDSSAG